MGNSCHLYFRSLERYIQRNKVGGNVAEIVNYMRQLISACAYLESKNIVHRDIKPANILLKGNKLKLADFGLARVIDT